MAIQQQIFCMLKSGATPLITKILIPKGGSANIVCAKPDKRNCHKKEIVIIH